ncbi:hypothetical protein DSO57_1004829 [Entomophthora muscae]|uniref:Uncharacterized protein n=1 Tax=Entomophthora muscae TaxID=34485 RepID=A0ACC2RMZ1_9FUNG|nr:hypothetical protein DSO57_1004829 [Entomophthora muscae]
MKTLLDLQATVKARFVCLEEILGLTPDADIPSFYRDNINPVFDVVCSMFMRQVAKIKQKANASISSREVNTLGRTIPILRQIFIYLSHKIQQGWQEETMVMFFTQLLHYGNHIKLRKDGLELLLIWLSVQRRHSEGPLWLFRNAIPLDIYYMDRLDISSNINEFEASEYIQLGQELIHLDDRTPLVPNPHPPSHLDSNILFRVILKNLSHLAFVASGSGSPNICSGQEESDETYSPPQEYFLGFSMDTANAAIKFMFGLFQKYYLLKLFPIQEEAAADAVKTTGDPSTGFERCPPSLIHLLLKFLIQNCLDDSAKLQGIRPSLSSRAQPSPACPILKKTIFSSDSTRKVINELLRQALLLLPYGFSSVCMEAVRSSILVIGTWFITEDHERPVFLRISQDSDGPVRDSSFNDHACTYIEMLHAVINWEVRHSAIDKLNTPVEPTEGHQHHRRMLSSEKAAHTDFTEAQALCYGEIYLVYQVVVSNPKLFESNSRLFVCQSLLEMNERLLHLISSLPSLMVNQASGKFEARSRYLAESFEGLYETLFYAWTITKVESQELWLTFQKSMIKSTMLTPVMDCWAATLRRLTHILASKLFEVEADPNSFDLEDLLTFGFKKHRKAINQAATTRRPIQRRNRSSLPALEIPHVKTSKRNYSISRRNSWKAGAAFLSEANNSSSSLAHTTQGFLVLSEYYRLAIAPNLPCSSSSSIHSEATSGGEEREEEHSESHVGILGHSFRQCPLADMDYASVEWTADEAIYIWKSVLCCLGNINQLRYNGHHERALLCVIEVYDSLQNVKSFKAPRGPVVPCAYEMATWIIHAADLPSPFDEGRLAAYAWMCRMLSNRRAHEQIIVSYGSAFYRQMLKGWSNTEPRLLSILITHGTHVFARDLQGVNLLAPVCLMSLQWVLLEQDPNEQLRQNAITIISSLIHLPYQFRGLDIPVLDYRQLLRGERAGRMAVDETKHTIQRLLLALLTEDEWSAHVENHPSTFGMVICALCVQLTHELVTPTPNPLFIRKGLAGILDQLYCTNHVLANSAIDCVSALASFVSFFTPEPAVAILEDIVGALNVHLNLHTSAATPQKSYTLTRLFACLLEWLMAAPHRLLDDPHLESLVLGTLDRGVHVESNSDVSDAAQTVLTHLVNHFGQDLACPSTNLVDVEVDGSLFLGFNGAVILTLSPTNRIIMRNPLGKFAWDVDSPPESPLSLEASPTSPVLPSARLPLLEADPADTPDLMADLIDSIESQFQELGHDDWVATTTLPPPEVPPTVPADTFKSPNWPLSKPSVEHRHRRACPEKLLLHRLNISAHHQFSAGQLVYLTESAPFLRDLKALDRKQSRETIKAGLIYVQDGQTNESSILCNQEPSQKYLDFVESLGWIVDLANHAGYLGGLEKSGANGTTAIYFCSTTQEIMFHDVTRMPNDPNDPQQVKKKRHIGNDPVHIVWNESRCDYSPCTIKGDFGNAQIIIHPLKNDMYDVRIHKDEHAGHFGPLLNGMVLSKRVLPSLVRAAVVNAHRSILCNSVGYHHNALNSSIQRARDIDAIIKKHKNASMPFDEVMSNIYDLTPQSPTVLAP